MTDRVQALTVVLEEDMRTDDVEALTEAITMLRGVLRVSALVTDASDHVARSRARLYYQEKLFKILDDEKRAR